MESKIYNQIIHCPYDYIYDNSIKIDKLWEEELVIKMCDYLKDDTDFIDVGAHIGLISLGINLIKTSVDNNFHCFECRASTFNFLQMNTKQHQNFILYNFALGNGNYIDNITVDNNYNSGASSIQGYGEKMQETDRKQYVSIIPLDSIKNMFKKPVSVLKIDIEGFEEDFLNGASEFLNIHRPFIFIEIYERNFKKVNEILEYEQYKLVWNSGCDYIYEPY